MCVSTIPYFLYISSISTRDLFSLTVISIFMIASNFKVLYMSHFKVKAWSILSDSFENFYPVCFYI